jgi:hypothetical protein
VVGSDTPDTFYLDLGRLPQLNNNHVMSILSATGNALNQSGFAVDVLPGLTAAENILSE